MRLLVTGGAGFIGSNFIIYWLNHYPKDSIVNLDKLTYAGNLDNLKSIENKENYKFVKGDICDENLVETLMKDTDIVCHFAAESHVDRSISNAVPFIKSNIVGTHILLEAAVKYNISRFHHVSTDEVFGSLPLASAEKFSEHTQYNPRSPYAASKAASDFLVRSYVATYGLRVTITNCSNNYGPYQHPEKLIPLAITNILEGLTVPVYGDGLYVRDWLYVEDHCRAINVVLKKGRIGETYFIGGLSKDLSNLDVLRKILQILNKDENQLEFVKDRPGHDRRYSIDWSKIHKELGWSPLNDFDEWLKTTIVWYQKNKDWWGKIKTGKFQDYYKNQYNKR